MTARSPAQFPAQVQVVIQTEDGGERNELLPTDQPISIGRHNSCVLHLDSDLVSRQHAVVEIGADMIRVEDVSTNGTMVGDMLLRRQAVDVPYLTPIVLGNFTVYFLQPTGVRARAPGGGGGPQVRRPGGAAPAAGGVDHAPHHDGGRGHGPARPTEEAPTGGLKFKLPGMEVKIITPEMKLKRERDVALRRDIHKMLIEQLDLATMDAQKLDDPSMRPKVLGALRRILQQIEHRIPPEMDRDTLIGELVDEALGLGPLERFIADPSITEIMVVDPDTIYIERAGKLTLSETRFTDDDRCRAVIERIVTPLGRRIDESSPLVDARLKDGSRVNAIIKPLALRGSCITIRKFSKVPLTLEKLVGFGALNERMAIFLIRSVIAKRNIVISGGTGSGKTTLLNCLSGVIPSNERIVTIEDAAELQLKQPHVGSLETR
ncbi:MAG: ATPase, T2SS/T4P/T4SS family, partial [Polyangiaceae bacterium]